jgi:hypothetical protein
MTALTDEKAAVVFNHFKNQPPNSGMLHTWESVRVFLFAGKATITLVSRVTGKRFTYKVRVKKSDLGKTTTDQVTYFLNLLRGPDNTADFTYMGVVRNNPPRFFWTAASGKVSREAPAYKALLWMLDAMAHERQGVLGRTLEIWHEGRCGCCGKLLTVPESIASGLGPVCEARRVA